MEETRIKAKDHIGSNEQSQAFIARVKKLKKGKFGKSKKKDMSKVQCFKCNEYGHFKRDCPNQQNNKRKKRSEGHVAKKMGEPEKEVEERRSERSLLLKKAPYQSCSLRILVFPLDSMHCCWKENDG